MTGQIKIDAMLALRSDGRLLVGRDRIAILEAIARRGSIMEAAKALGFSYKTAWDAVAAINNLMPRPVVIAQAGGARGGGAAVTPEGLQLVAACRRLEEKLGRISTLIAEEGLDGRTDLPVLERGDENQCTQRVTLRGERGAPRRRQRRGVLKLSDTQSILAVIINESADDLGLVAGREALALVKASFVMLARHDDGLRLSTPNQLPGTVVERTDGGVTSEVALDIGRGRRR